MRIKSNVEVVLRNKLNNSRPAGTRYLARGGSADQAIRLPKVGMIEGIKEFSSELQAVTLKSVNALSTPICQVCKPRCRENSYLKQIRSYRHFYCCGLEALLRGAAIAGIFVVSIVELLEL